jgi:hypothetical protein
MVHLDFPDLQSREFDILTHILEENNEAAISLYI